MKWSIERERDRGPETLESRSGSSRVSDETEPSSHWICLRRYVHLRHRHLNPTPLSLQNPCLDDSASIRLTLRILRLISYSSPPFERRGVTSQVVVGARGKQGRKIRRWRVRFAVGDEDAVVVRDAAWEEISGTGGGMQMTV